MLKEDCQRRSRLVMRADLLVTLLVERRLDRNAKQILATCQTPLEANEMLWPAV
jgi:hypothetical protein